MADSAGRLVEFSREYGYRARDLQRTGPLPGTLASIEQCDEMIQHQRRIQDLLGRLREMLVTEHHAVLHRSAHPERSSTSTAADVEMDDPRATPDDPKANGLHPADGRKRRGVRPSGFISVRAVRPSPPPFLLFPILFSFSSLADR